MKKTPPTNVPDVQNGPPVEGEIPAVRPGHLKLGEGNSHTFFLQDEMHGKLAALAAMGDINLTVGPSDDTPPEGIKKTPSTAPSEGSESEGGEGGGEGPPEGKVAPSPMLLEAARMINEQNPDLKVEAIALFDSEKHVDEFRERLFGPTMIENIHNLQNKPRMRKINDLAYENFLSPEIRKEFLGRKWSKKLQPSVAVVHKLVVDTFLLEINAEIIQEDELWRIVQSAFDKIPLGKPITDGGLRNVTDEIQEKLYYYFVSQADAYKSGLIVLENIGLLLGLEPNELMKLIYENVDSENRRRFIIELAAGNAEFSRTIIDARDSFEGLRQLDQGIPEKGHVTRKLFREAVRQAVLKVGGQKFRVDRHIVALDSAPKFVEKARKKGVFGLRADLCTYPEEVFQSTGLPPNHADLLFENLFLDRMTNLQPFILKRLLAKSDGSTQFIVGFFVPFSANMESFSRNENIPKIECFDSGSDGMRKSWQNLGEAETICNIVSDFHALGFKTTRIAEQPYEVYGVHSIAEKAGELRSNPKWEFLRTHDFGNAILNERRDDVFNGTTPDEEKVGFPERSKLVLISGTVSPLYGRLYEALAIRQAKHGMGLEIHVDPNDPKYAFLEWYNFQRKNLNKRCRRIFSSGKPGVLPYEDGMKDVRREFLELHLQQ